MDPCPALKVRSSAFAKSVTIVATFRRTFLEQSEKLSLISTCKETLTWQSFGWRRSPAAQPAAAPTWKNRSLQTMKRSRQSVAALCLIWASVLPTRLDAQTAPPWPDTFLTRLESLALIETLNASLLAARSATFTLDKWCTDHKLADETKIRAGSFAASTNRFRPSSANAWNLMRTSGLSSATSNSPAATASCPKPTTGMCRRGSPPK